MPRKAPLCPYKRHDCTRSCTPAMPTTGIPHVMASAQPGQYVQSWASDTRKTTQRSTMHSPVASPRFFVLETCARRHLPWTSRTEMQLLEGTWNSPGSFALSTAACFSRETLHIFLGSWFLHSMLGGVRRNPYPARFDVYLCPLGPKRQEANWRRRTAGHAAWSVGLVLPENHVPSQAPHGLPL